VTEPRPPGERLLELVVFAPAGLAVTVVEEFPKLVEKGRHRVEGQVHAARLVGQFAVQMGRRQLDQAMERLGADRAARPETEHHGHSNDERDGAHSVFHGDAPGTDNGGGAAPTAGRDVGPFVAPPTSAGDASSALAIPNYDSLSASQVVQRLDGLSPAELHDVRAHETAHRRRRTILHRVEQLLAGQDAPQT